MSFRKFLPIFLFSAIFVAGCCQNEAKPVSKEVVEQPAAPVDGDKDKDGISDNMDTCPDTPAGAMVNGKGCWHLSGLYFANNSAKISKNSYRDLNRVVDVLTNNPSVKILIEGHTDSNGDASYNESLSQRRADTVKGYLVGKGISADRLTTKGYGESMPVASNKTKYERKLNRRVVLTPQ